MNRDKLIFLLVAIFVLSSAAYGQHYEFIRTDTNASNLVQNATINDESLEAGDEIAVFTPDGVCAGAAVIHEGEPPIGCTAFGDDAQTQEVDGFHDGEVIEYRIWDASSEREVVAEPTFRAGRVQWAVNQFNVLDLAATMEEEGPEISYVATYDTPGSSRDVFILNDLAYVADWESGLSIIDVSDPENPVGVGHYDTPGSAAGVTVSGDYAYVTDWDNGFVILDVSNPEDIAFVGRVNTPGNAADVIISGYYALVADWVSGVQFINIADPTEPEIVANVNVNGDAVNIALKGDVLFVTFNGTGLVAFDVSDMRTPELISSCAIDMAYGVDIIDNLAYVSHWEHGLTVVDITNVNDMQIVGSCDTPGIALNVAVYGNLAFVSDRYTGLTVVDVADYQAMDIVSTYDTASEARTTQLVGDYAFVADWTSGLVVLDVSQLKVLDESPAFIANTPSVLDYGAVQVGETVEFSVLVSNRGGDILEITDVYTDGEGFGVVFDAVNLLPGANALIPVEFTPEAEGDFQGVLTVATNANNAEINLSGTGAFFEIPALEFDPDMLDFGEVEIGNEGELVLTITNNTDEEVQVVSVMSDNEAFYTDFENEPQGPRYVFRRTDVSHSLLVRETSLNGEPLQIDDEIGVFTPDGLCGGAGIIVEVGAQLGLGAFGDDAQTQEVDGFAANEEFEYRFWDSSAYREYIAEPTYIGGVNQDNVFASNGFSVLNLAAENQLAPVAPGAELDITVYFAPDAEADFDGLLTIRTNVEGFEVTDIPMSGVGYVVEPPQISVAPAAIDFGDVVIGERGTDRLTITNIGGGILHVGDITSDNEVFGVEWQGAALSAGQSANVTVFFVPEAEEFYEGQLRIVSDDQEQQVVMIDLAGSGVGAAVPVIAFDPEDLLDFGNVLVGEDGEIVLNVINNGRADLTVSRILSNNDVFTHDFENPEEGPHYHYRQTDVSHSLLVQEAYLNGEPLQIDDEIGIFTPDNLCGGAGTIIEVGAQLGIGAWVDDAQTDEIDGFRANEAISYRVWDATAFREYDAEARYVGGPHQNGLFVVNGFSVLVLNAGDRLDPADVAEVVVAPGEGFDVSVIFAPTEDGEFEGILTVFSNDPENPEATLRMVGFGGVPNEPDIEISDNAYDFGDVLVGDSERWILDVTNVGNEVLFIRDAIVNGDGFVAELQNDVLEPNQSTEIFIIFSPEEAMDYQARMVITSNDPDEAEVVVELAGSGYIDALPEIYVNVDGLDFGQVELNQVGELQAVIANHGQDVLVIDAIESDNGVFWTDYEDEPPAGPRFRFRATDISHSLLIRGATLNGAPLDVDDEIGIFTEDGLCGGAAVIIERGADIGIGVFGDDAQTEEVDGFAANEAFEFRFWDVSSRREIIAQPEYIGGINREFQFVSNGFTVLSLTAGEGFNPAHIAESVLEPGEEMVVTVFFGPEEAGEYEGTLTIYSNDPNNPEWNVSMFGIGGTFEPMIEVSDEAYDFRALWIGESEDWTLTVRNIGEGDLVIEDVITTGDYFSDNMGELTLQPGASEDIIVAFSPETGGFFEGNVTILSNDPQNGEVHVTLVGEGRWIPQVRLVPGEAIDFGRIAVGETAEDVIEIHNDGQAEVNIADVIVEGDGFFIGDVEPGEPPEFDWDYFQSDQSMSFLVNEATIDGEPLAMDDFVGVFTPGGYCAGIGQPADDGRVGLAAFGADGDHPGFRENDPVAFRFWDSDARMEYRAQASYVAGPNHWANNGFAVVRLAAEPRFNPMAPAEFTIEPGEFVRVPVYFLPEAQGDYEGLFTTTFEAPDEGVVELPLFGEGYVPPGLLIDPPELNFGEVIVGENSTLVFNLANEGAGPLNVQSLEVIGDFFSIENGEGFVLESGQNREIPVTFAPENNGMFEGGVNIISNDPFNGNVTVNLVGAGVWYPVIRIEPEAYDFGRVIVGEIEEGMFNIYNDGLAPLVVSDISVDGDYFSLDPEFGGEEPGQFNWRYNRSDVSLNVLVRGALLGDESLVEGDVIGVFTPGGVCAGFSEVPVGFPDENLGLAVWAAEGQNPGFLANEQLNYRYWDASVGREYVAHAEYLQGHGRFEANAFFVATLVSEGRHEGQALAEWIIEPDGSLEVPVFFLPEEAGEFEGRITILSNDPENAEISAPLVGEGYYLPPEIVIAEMAHDFGGLNIGEAADWSFTIENNGQLDLEVSNLSIEGDGFILHHDAEFVVAGGGMEEIPVMFEPNHAGEFSATITILSNDPENGELMVEVTGVGVAAVMVLNENRFDFGEVFTGEEGVLDIVIANEGNADLIIDDMVFNNEVFDIEIGSSEFDWDYQFSDVGMNILIQEALLDGEALVMDDFVGVFTPDGVCGGFGQPGEDGRVGLSAWGAEGDNPGFADGDQLNFRFWDASAGREYRADIQYINGYHGNFEVNGFAVGNLYAGERFNPMAFEGPIVIEPGAEVAGLLYFHPAEEMEYEGILTIISNNFENAEVEVGLIGVGIAPNHPPIWVDVPEADEATEDALYELVVVAEDIDGDELTLSMVDLIGNLPVAVEDVFVDNGDGTGTLTWEIDFDAAGEYVLQFVADDGVEPTATVLNLRVLNVNRAPMFVEYPEDVIEVSEMDEVSFDLVAIDPDGDNMEMLYDGDLPEEFEFDYDGEGNASFYWVPSYDNAGEYTAYFNVNDGDLGDDIEVHFVVNNFNRAPEVVAPIDDIVVEEDCGHTVIANLNEVFVDPDGDELMFEIAEGADELNLAIDDGFLSFEPDENYFGTSDVIIIADDGHEGEMIVAATMFASPVVNNNRNLRAVRSVGQLPATPNRDVAVDVMFSVTVEAVNDEPVVVEAIDDVVIDEDHGVYVVADLDNVFDDVEDDALDFSFIGAPNDLNMEIDEENVLFFAASDNFNLPNGVEIAVRAIDDDEDFATETFMVTINPVNDAPVVAEDIEDIVVDEDSGVRVVAENLNSIFYDVDEDELAFDLVEAGPAGLNMTLEGVELWFNPEPNFSLPDGADIIVQASDAEESVQVSFVVTVIPTNDIPEWVMLPNQVVSVSETEIVEFAIVAEDMDADVLEYILEAPGLPEGANFTDNGDGSADFYWETTYNDFGWYDLRIVLSDGTVEIDFEMSIEVLNALQHFEYPQVSDASHNLLIQDLILNGETVPVDWEIGVVTPGGVVAGAEPWNGNGEGVGVAVWGDDQGTDEIDGFHSGEEMTFVIWDPVEDREYRGEAHIVQGSITWENNGFTVMSLEALVARDLTIDFRLGWNLISLNVSPGAEFYTENEVRGPDVRLMLEQFRDGDNHHVLLIKNDRGRFYYPGINFCNIAYWNLEEGYAVRMDEATQGQWSGEPIPADTEFPVYHGWNYVPYYPTYELSARSPEFYVLSPIIEYVVLAKNGLGRFMAPSAGPTGFSNMPDWRESQGYQVRLDLEGRDYVDFSYPEPQDNVAMLSDKIAPVESHYTELVSTGANMSVLVSSISGVSYSAYDEIAAYTADGKYVGFGTIDQNGQCGIAVWGDDETTEEIEGLINGESFELRLWDSRSATEVGLMPTNVYIGSGLTYTIDDFVLLDVTMKPVIPEEFYLSNAYPNPFNAITRLTFGMPEEGMVSVKVYDLSGRLVATLVNEIQPAGVHTAMWNGEGLVSGIYVIRLETNGFHSSRKVALIK